MFLAGKLDQTYRKVSREAPREPTIRSPTFPQGKRLTLAKAKGRPEAICARLSQKDALAKKRKQRPLLSLDSQTMSCGGGGGTIFFGRHERVGGWQAFQDLGCVGFTPESSFEVIQTEPLGMADDCNPRRSQIRAAGSRVFETPTKETSARPPPQKKRQKQKQKHNNTHTHKKKQTQTQKQDKCCAEANPKEETPPKHCPALCPRPALLPLCADPRVAPRSLWGNPCGQLAQSHCIPSIWLRPRALKKRKIYSSD